LVLAKHIVQLTVTTTYFFKNQLFQSLVTKFQILLFHGVTVADPNDGQWQTVVLSFQILPGILLEFISEGLPLFLLVVG